ncbi:hypothetical protein EYC84_010818 [Monilinia fructicola]|uniref:WSC domain-containing protein n=1 Tax=Monilinia fructicola TaxID=38448 RepID=A0A5M9JBL4_MONFR|nr:hypothetical protein EYC84_010818 [Monilinia fructicola]
MQATTLFQLTFCLLTFFINPTFAFWRLPCTNPIVVQRADPVISPGSVSGHVHTIMGGNGFGFSMDYASTQKSTYPLDPEYANGLLAFPEGFRMVAGNPYLRSFNSSSLEQAAVTYVCLGTSNPQTNGFPNYKCPLGLRSQVFFPSCWDGVNTNSSTYVNHMAYPSLTDSGHCPASHPKRFVSIFYEILWNTPDFADMWYGDSQPFVWAMGDPTGYGFHEFLHQFMKQFLGVLPALPGCNPVQSGPANAVQQTGCGATTTIGTPMWPYTDVTKTKGYAYIGCGFDTAGAARTLQGASLTNNTGMTIESCIDFCNSKGFSIAGVEYSTQCFCDNSILAGRAPVPGLVGNCAMPCSGNSAEMCGGPALLSLYQKCPSTNNCTNIVYPFNSGLKKPHHHPMLLLPHPILPPAQTSSVPTLVPVATSASTKSTLNSSNSGTEVNTEPSSVYSNSDIEVTTVITTTTSTTLVIVAATALSPFDHSCNEDNCLRGLQHSAASGFCSSWLATTVAPTAIVPTGFPGCDFAPNAAYHISSGCSCFQKTATDS